jgi:phospho-N-acetylmuramoyl-pentapeptide-transferase
MGQGFIGLMFLIFFVSPLAYFAVRGALSDESFYHSLIALLIAGVPALVFVLVTAMPYIRALQRRYLGQYIREDGPQSHHSKKGTPTAGGLLILSGMSLGLVSYSVLTLPVLGDFLGEPVSNWQTLVRFALVPTVTLILGAMGFWDDFLKIAKKHNKGLSGYSKLAVQGLVGVGAGWLMMQAGVTPEINLFGLGSLELGWAYPLWVALVITGTSNAVNITDGLDGLAASTSIVTLFLLAFFVQVLAVDPLPAMAGTIPAWTLLCATLGFLVFNRNPARIFMGDCGSLALGGAIATLALLAHAEMWLLLLGGVFVMETLSVILQVISFKTTGKRIFKMSPIHHHFELCGWHETKVVKCFILIQILLGVTAIFL